MLNVNKWLADALAAGGIHLPACEEPMLRQVSGSYITWEHGETTTLRASGIPYEQRYRVTLLLWLTPDDLWQSWLMDITAALMRFDTESSVTCYVGMSRGARDVPEVGRKLVQLEVQLVDRM